jgi:hypothetical protein
MQQKWRLQSKLSIEWWAIVCSTFVWMSRASTRRTPQNPEGSTTSQAVAEANKMLARTVLLITFGIARLIAWGLEQPSSSILPQTRRFKKLKQLSVQFPKLAPFHEVYMYMGNYGANTEKPTKLWSSEPWIGSFAGRRPVHLQRRGIRDGATAVVHGTKVYGKRQELKASQAYPKAFGQAIFREWGSHSPTCEALSSDGVSDETDLSAWSDCEPDSLCAVHGVPKDRWAF